MPFCLTSLVQRCCTVVESRQKTHEKCESIEFTTSPCTQSYVNNCNAWRVYWDSGTVGRPYSEVLTRGAYDGDFCTPMGYLVTRSGAHSINRCLVYKTLVVD